MGQGAAPDPFAALGDPTRRQILQLIGRGERSVQQIADDLPVSRPAVSRHLRLLKSAGLVSERVDGTRHFFSLDERGARAAQQYMARVWGESITRFRVVAENTRPRARK